MAVRIWTGKDTKADTGPEFYEVTWEGRVLALREYNGYDDSDFYAIAWDDEAGDTREVWYATTRGWTYNNSAAVDADEATLAKYAAYRKQRAADYQAACDATEAEVPRAGRRVQVVKGRKVPAGTTGEVFWHGKDRYARGNHGGLWGDDGRTGYRVGFKTAGGEKFFTAATNVKVVTEAAAVAAA